ncbi:MAG: hypothetical protein JWR83_2857, partial [Aeromicrobium sp.]|nr:hypothetical protein [Aeromicrobium sp.]
MTNTIITTSAIARAKALRAEGKYDEAEAIFEAYGAELASKEQALANATHKVARKARLELADKVDPENDDEVAKHVAKLKVRMLAASIIVPGIVDPAPYAAAGVNRWAHTDGGPAAKGQAAPPCLLFERIIESVDPATAAKAIESKLDARMNQV